MSPSREVFIADLDRFNKSLRDMGAVITESDGSQWIDTFKVPTEFLNAYTKLVSIGYAKGYIK